MEKIKIYHSLGKQLLYILGCFVFVVICLFLKEEYGFIAWTGILFFGGGGLFLTFTLLKERLSKTPFISISDESILVTSPQKREIKFADIEEVSLVEIKQTINGMTQKTPMIGINYKEEAYQRVLENKGLLAQALTPVNEDISGTHDTIPVDGLSISPENLLNILQTKLGHKKHL